MSNDLLVLGEGVDKKSVALAFFGELNHIMRVEAVIQRVVGEQRTDQLRIETVEDLTGGQESLDGSVVLRLHEAHLYGRRPEHTGGIDCHGHSADLIRHDAKGNAGMPLHGDGVADISDDVRVSGAHQRLLQVLDVYYIGPALEGLERLFEILDANH